MKLENLAIIFVIIIVPITIVLSEYIDGKIDTKKLELEYNKRLLSSTQAAINAYKANTVENAYGDVTNSKIADITTATNIFFNSLAANFNFVGQKAREMKEYVPAVAFTLYDGYYIFSPFNNTLTEVPTSNPDNIDSNDETYSKDGETFEGLKPYVYYTCRYAIDEGNDFIITYTLDNYITITGLINKQYVYDYGYLYNGITYNSSNKSYTYDGVTYTQNDTEQMKEYLGDGWYSYAKINGKKYYLDESYYKDRTGLVNYDIQTSFPAGTAIFYIDDNGQKNYSQTNGYSTNNTDEKNKEFVKYYRAITKNKSAYEYYKNAYEFSKAVLGTPVSGYTDKANNEAPSEGYNLENIKFKDSYIYKNPTSSIIDNTSNAEDLIFTGSPQYESSNFNKHRKEVIKYVVETNLNAAISGYASKSVDSFIMPKISEENWELIQNHSCAIAFMQGMSLGNKRYNGYSVVANSFTKEHIDENDIYILKDDTYCRITDKTLSGTNIQSKDTYGYYAGIWKLNFEQKQGINSSGETIYYIPMSYNNGGNPTGYIGSYTSIVGIAGINSLNNRENDTYKYVEGLDENLKRAYYYALGRERWGSFNINNVNFEIYGGNGSEYFLKDYE